MPLDEVLDSEREKRTAPIGVEDQAGRRPPLRQSHREGLVRERLVEQRRHRPADDPSGVEIEHDGEMEPALPGAHRGDIGDPAPVGCLGREVAPQAIGRGWQLGPGRRGPAEAPLGTGDDALAPHEAGNAVSARPDAPGAELLVNARRSIGPPARDVRRPGCGRGEHRCVRPGAAMGGAPTRRSRCARRPAPGRGSTRETRSDRRR
jgi:hypothetical protein